MDVIPGGGGLSPSNILPTRYNFSMVTQWCRFSSSHRIYFLTIKFCENHFRPDPTCVSLRRSPGPPSRLETGTFLDAFGAQHGAFATSGSSSPVIGWKLRSWLPPKKYNIKSYKFCQLNLWESRNQYAAEQRKEDAGRREMIKPIEVGFSREWWWPQAC